MNLRKLRRGAGTLTVAVVTLSILAGTALAYWTTSGTGAGSGAAADFEIEIEAVTGSSSVALIPDSAGDLVLRVNNPNGYAVTLTSVVGNGVVTNDCGQTGVSAVPQTGLAISIIPGSQEILVPNAVHMDATAATECQGATFLVPVTVRVQSS